MKNTLLTPALKLMGRLRLLPKFIVLTIIFVLPLALTTSLLLTELDKSIEFTRQERTGITQVRKVQEIIQLAQKHRVLQHVSIMGNAGATPKAQLMQKEIAAKIAAFDTLIQSEPELHAEEAWMAIKKNWAALQEKSSAKERKIYNEHTALIAQLYRFNTLIADRTNLTHDPEAVTYYLAELFAGDFPKITEGLSEVAGRGAAYIDSGLMEANEEVLLGSTVLVTRRDLGDISGKIDMLLRESPNSSRKWPPH